MKARFNQEIYVHRVELERAFGRSGAGVSNLSVGQLVSYIIVLNVQRKPQ